ncbi:AAA family ATPase [Virgibacillus sp. YIM 98842]|uniref:AAA family ATPase n=1 Tax=Virgibacillus sp. YIM 98842 TaxID=2663533 RepID=UPI001F09C12B|nr:AAA family ATPase [Virgibacillus sp. YIM 98842]
MSNIEGGNFVYLKSFGIYNFRKFGTTENTIEFVDGTSYRKEQKEEEINVAPTTTLIVGKNNSGKTTVVQALEKLIKEKKFNVNDFNFVYLKEILHRYKETYSTTNKLEKVEIPNLRFIIKIGFEDNLTKDLLGNLAPFLIIDNITKMKEVEITIKLEIKETELYIQEVIKLLEKGESDKEFTSFIKILRETDFEVNYYRQNGDPVKYDLKNLIDITVIKANIVDSDTSLTKAFNKIIKYRYKSLLDDREKEDFEELLDETNSAFTEKIRMQHTTSISDSLSKIESREKLSFSLTADLNLESIMNNLVRYEYVEGNIHIPENQFGLGYTNLMMIIAELVDYMEKYPDKSFNSMVNIISIEEPETYMHPQMQELFIKNINEAIKSLLDGKEKNINSQLIITTHSSHILNSKIHSGNTFNNINYLTTEGPHTQVIKLNDANVVKVKSKGKRSKEESDKLNFLRKHIKYKVSELFFADAIIFVEGITEETLLKYFIDNDKELNKYYITIFNIDGSHGLVYHDLIKLLQVPTLVITDIDIKRNKDEKDKLMQIRELSGRETTNETIKKYNDSEFITDIEPFFQKENLYIAFQSEKIHEYYASSFEEALILTNYANDFMNRILKNVKKQIYKEVTESKIGVDRNKVKDNSYLFQNKLEKEKSNFANTILYELITSKDNELMLPSYITNGLKWLTRELRGEGT